MVTKRVERDCNTCMHHVQGCAAVVAIPPRCRWCLRVSERYAGSIPLPLWEPIREEGSWFQRIVQRLVRHTFLSH